MSSDFSPDNLCIFRGKSARESLSEQYFINQKTRKTVLYFPLLVPKQKKYIRKNFLPCDIINLTIFGHLSTKEDRTVGLAEKVLKDLTKETKYEFWCHVSRNPKNDDICFIVDDFRADNIDRKTMLSDRNFGKGIEGLADEYLNKEGGENG